MKNIGISQIIKENKQEIFGQQILELLANTDTNTTYVLTIDKDGTKYLYWVSTWGNCGMFDYCVHSKGEENITEIIKTEKLVKIIR